MMAPQRRPPVCAWVGVGLTLLAPVIARADDAEQLPSPLRLEDAVAYAANHRAEISAARQRANAAGERPAIVSALEDPVVSPSVDHLPFMLNGANLSFALEQRVPLSGLLAHRERGAEAEARRLRADGDRVALDVELDAATAFLMLRERRETAVILREQVKLAEAFVRAATARYAAGNGAQGDALRAEIEVARLAGAVRSIEAEIRAAEVMLNTSLGRDGTASIPPLDAHTSTIAPPAPERVRETALGARPELVAGAAEVNRADAEIASMESMYWPMAMVRTGPAYTMSDGAGWMLMVGISVPIWRGRLDSGVREAQAMAEMARSDLSAMRRMVAGDALASREQVLASLARFLSLRDAVLPRAKLAIEPTLSGYASGQLPLVSVLEAAQALWSAQSELVSAHFELDFAWARLRRAQGEKERTS